MKPILFLDIDGVLNSHAWSKRCVLPPDFGQIPNWKKQATECIDPDAVAQLNRIVEESRCAVVLSSSWRKAEPLHRVTRILRYRGFKHDLLACTPDLSHRWTTYEDRPRGNEILHWFKTLLGWNGEGQYQYAIVDDDSDFLEHQWPHFVQTSGERGLTEIEATQLIEILKREP